MSAASPTTPQRDEACAVALFEARGKAGRIEDAIYERICELFGEDVIEDTSHDEYDMSIELYTTHDIVPTVDQITAITAMGFSCGWINFPDETQISFNKGQISKRHKRSYDKYPKNPRRAALSERESSEIERLKEALRQVKAFVVGEKSPNWYDDTTVYLTRGKIADICDFALAHPDHPRDVHLTVEKR